MFAILHIIANNYQLLEEYINLVNIMLVQFSFKNYKLFKEKVKKTMVSSLRSTFGEQIAPR